VITRINYSLKTYNTFGIDAIAKHFVSIENEKELVEFICNSPLRANLNLVLGGGSNMLLTKDIDGTVLHINLKGKQIISEDDKHAIVEVFAGENWHEFVLWAIAHGLGGVENLSLIPGNTGTAPVQNIGAYGVEIKDVIVQVEAVHLTAGTKKIFSNNDCQFGYRESIFKNGEKGNYIITKVLLKLTKEPHQLSTHYGAIKEELTHQGIENPTIKDVSNAVIAIRQSKLPDPKIIGNSGSFFKNPILPAKQVEALKLSFPELPVYPAQEGFNKVAAGWLIEQAGWKGYRRGDAGIHAKQALVLVNYGKATGEELISLAHDVIASVKQKFGLELSPEVNII